MGSIEPDVLSGSNLLRRVWHGHDGGQTVLPGDERTVTDGATDFGNQPGGVQK